MPANRGAEKKWLQARFVFRGTVEVLRAANVAQVEDTSNTIIVRVDEVIQAPEVLGTVSGQKITLKLAPKEKVTAHQQAIFYCNGWLMGDNIAVESLGHVDVARRGIASLSAAAAPNPQDREVQDRVATADMVVAGTVVAVRLPDEPAPGQSRAGRNLTPARRKALPARRPISEHDPEWREAVVEVASVEKGSSKRKSLVLRFPSSRDVRWYKAPKFEAGQQGLFILHKTTAPSTRGATRRAFTLTHAEAGTTKEIYTALHPADFQPPERHQDVKTLIQGAGATSTRKPRRARQTPARGTATATPRKTRR